MKKKRSSMNKRALLLFLIFSVLFFTLTYRFFVIQLTGQAEGKVLAAYANEKYSKERTLEASRGSLLDINGEPLAIDTVAYRLVAILDPSVTPENADIPNHVVDREKTAAKLAQYIDLEESEIYEILSDEDAFQVEFGKAGKSLSYETKEAIESLELPGITFIRETKRSYPNGVFASHLLGFANYTGAEGEDKLVGQMGLESALNSYLEGKNGKIKYQSDRWGFVLPNGESDVVAPKNGADVYLTIDKKIQMFLEDAMTQVQEDYSPKNMMAVVADAKTGAILAMAQRPTFNPNTREGLDETWQNTIVETAFEPGSTMKIITLASAIEEGVFNPNEKYPSGSYKVPGGPITDHNNIGWGEITYLEGVQRSSNVAFAYLLEKMGDDTFRTYLDKFKIGQETGIGLPNEARGNIRYEWPIEKVSTAFGQATSVTALQLVQAMTAITNDGKMMKPYVIDKIVGQNGEVIKGSDQKQVGTPISSDTAKTTLDILETVVSSDDGTGHYFAIDEYMVAGKTGTAQIYSNEEGGYLSGWNNYIFSFIGAAPKDDPRLIVYVMVQQPELTGFEAGSIPVSKIFNPVMKNSLQYLNIEPDDTVEAAHSKKLPDLSGKTVSQAISALDELKLSSIVIGEGQNVSATVPSAKTELLDGEKVILMTDGKLTMPDITGWSLADTIKLADAASISLSFEGQGFVASQSLPPGTVLTKDSKLKVTLKTPLELMEENIQAEDAETGTESETEASNP